MAAGLARLRPVAERDLPLLERLPVDPEMGGPLAWYGYGDAGAIRRRFQQDGFLTEDYGRLMVDTPAGGGAETGGRDAGGRDAGGPDAGGLETVGLVSWNAVTHGPPAAARCWNVGIVLLPEARNRGIGTAAQRALAAYLFEVTPVMRLEATTLVGNVAERRALEKAGFTAEGVLRSATFVGGAWRDVAIYSRLRTD